MYCILITGIPAAGKTTMAAAIAERFKLPIISKDVIKEIMFDDIGFQSRSEKVKLGIASMNIMYYLAEQLMKTGQPFILENNFETSSKEGIINVLEKYSYTAITVTITGKYKIIYERFCKRNDSPNRHRGHIVNDCYPEKEPGMITPPMSYENYVNAVTQRGMDNFVANGPHIIVDVTDFTKLDRENILLQIKIAQEAILSD